MAYISANLILHDERGYILCKEKRSLNKGDVEKVLLSHLIGGKMEVGETAKFAAVREMIEELGISRRTPKERRFADSLMKLLLSGKMRQIDIKVSDTFKNACFILDIEQFNTEKNSQLYNYLHNLVSDFKKNNIVEELFYWNVGEEISDPTTLLQKFIDILDEELNPRTEHEEEEDENGEEHEIKSQVSTTPLVTAKIETINLDDF